MAVKFDTRKHEITAKLERLQPEGNDRAFFLLSYLDKTMAGYHENNVYLSLAKGGAIVLSDDTDGYIYLYPEQVRNLKKALGLRTPRKGK